MAVCQNLVPLVNIKIAGKWMFIPLKMVLIGIDPYPYQSTLGFAIQDPAWWLSNKTWAPWEPERGMEPIPAWRWCSNIYIYDIIYMMYIYNVNDIIYMIYIYISYIYIIYIYIYHIYIDNVIFIWQYIYIYIHHYGTSMIGFKRKSTRKQWETIVFFLMWKSCFKVWE